MQKSKNCLVCNKIMKFKPSEDKKYPYDTYYCPTSWKDYIHHYSIDVIEDSRILNIGEPYLLERISIGDYFIEIAIGDQRVHLAEIITIDSSVTITKVIVKKNFRKETVLYGENIKSGDPLPRFFNAKEIENFLIIR